MTISVKVFGATPPCARCKETEKIANKVAERFPGQVVVSKYAAISEEGCKYGILFTPTVLLNDRVIATGKVISESELEKEIKKELEVK